jgi:hypothetical protein
MLYFRVFAKRISRSPAVPSPSRIPIPPPLSPNSHGINPFADPHPLNPVASILYKNIGGQGASTFHSSSRIFYLPKSFTICRSKTPLPQPLYNPHLRTPLVSAGNKGLLTSLESALTENPPVTSLESALTKNGWGGVPLLTRISSVQSAQRLRGNPCPSSVSANSVLSATSALIPLLSFDFQPSQPLSHPSSQPIRRLAGIPASDSVNSALSAISALIPLLSFDFQLSTVSFLPLQKDSSISATQYFVPIVERCSDPDDTSTVRGEARLPRVAVNRRESK